VEGGGVKFTTTARSFGIFSAAATAILVVAYAVTLAVGLLTLESPQQPIGGPLFTILEVLIMLMMPAMVALMVAVDAKALTLTSLVFMSLLAGETFIVHFCILTLSHQPEFRAQSWLPLVLSFEWPSVTYALDILGWDVFFPLSMLFAALVFQGSRLATWIRVLMIASGVLSLAGLSGVVAGDMQLRNIGVVGYVGVFLVVAALLAVLFYRTTPQEA
jgi:hypothetical protein